MKAIHQLHDLDQSYWLDDIARGPLVAFYEHTLFKQGRILNIDSSDQWGVKVGEVLAKRFIPKSESAEHLQLQNDISTNTLILQDRGLKGGRS
jgi:glucose-6-phosphate isomerase